MAHFPARGRSLLASLLIAVTIFGALASALPWVRASASPAWTVSLDANSISGTDVMLDASAMQGKSFRVGAVINASNSAPLKGVYGWQFEIEYNSSAFIPQGDPGGTSYPDGAQNTVLFGSQTTVGTVNWAGRINANGAFASYIILPEFTSGLAKIVVVWVLLAPSSSLTISAKTLLANVGFELLDKPGSPQAFKIGGVKFVDNDAFGIPNVIAG